MNIRDVIRETDGEELAALAQFFVGRADDENAAGEISVDAFMQMASKMGINIDKDTLQSAVQSGQLGGIADMNDDKITFKSKKAAELNPADQYTSMDHAKMTMKQAAKRAANKRK
jgi:hypothetical protein